MTDTKHKPKPKSSQSRRRDLHLLPSGTSILWVGSGDALRDAAFSHSQQAPTRRLALSAGAGFQLNFYEVEGQSERLAQTLVAGADQDSTAFAYLSLLETFRQGSIGFVVLEYDPNTIQWWAVFFDKYNIEFCLYFSKKPTVNWKQWAFICAATARLVATDEIHSWWKSALIFDSEITRTGEELFTHVSMQISALAKGNRFHKKIASRSEAADVAIISYYYSPVRSVAMQRLNYWSDEIYNISKDMGHAFDPHVITATNHYNHRSNVTVIRDFGDLLPYHGKFKRTFDLLTSQKINTIGVSWSQRLHGIISANKNAFMADAVLISGNPFFYFEIGAWYKTNLNSTVVYDFRDPFAGNPRIRYKTQQRLVLKDMERNYLKSADIAIAVNKTCLDLITQFKSVQYLEVANGYDERVVNKAKPLARRSKRKTKFIYAGTFYPDCSAENFVKAMDPKKHEFDHYGLNQKDHDVLLKYDSFNWHGPTSYPSVVSAAKSSDVGLIFTGGKKFEQTTKIFDYIAADIDIVIVTEGTAKTGEIHNMTRDLERVYWVENKPKKIAKFFETFKVKRGARKNKTSFTRKAQAQKLITLLNSFSDPDFLEKQVSSRGQISAEAMATIRKTVAQEKKASSQIRKLVPTAQKPEVKKSSSSAKTQAKKRGRATKPSGPKKVLPKSELYPAKKSLQSKSKSESKSKAKAKPVKKRTASPKT